MTPRRPDFSPSFSKAGPGPGAYEGRNLIKRSPAFSLGRSQRTDFTKSDNIPGPGNYTTTAKSGSGI
jgi:hypothetical protein